MKNIDQTKNLVEFFYISLSENLSLKPKQVIFFFHELLLYEY